MTFLKKNINTKEHLYHSATLAFIGACQKEMKTSPKQAYSKSRDEQWWCIPLSTLNIIEWAL